MKKIESLAVNSVEEWATVAQKLLSELNGRTTICMTGPLGAGKTTLTRAIVEHLGGSEEEVQSPTFSLVHEYTLNQGADYTKIYHLDLYRVEDAQELLAIGLYDLLDSDDLVIIEWPKIAFPLMDRNEYLLLTLEHQKSGRRLILEN